MQPLQRLDICYAVFNNEGENRAIPFPIPGTPRCLSDPLGEQKWTGWLFPRLCQ